MRSREVSKIDSIASDRRLVFMPMAIAVLLFALISADKTVLHPQESTGVNSASEEIRKSKPEKKNSRSKRIKRLKLADPESSETMLA